MSELETVVPHVPMPGYPRIYRYFYPRCGPGDGIWDFGWKCGRCGLRFSEFRHGGETAFALARAHTCQLGDTNLDAMRRSISAEEAQCEPQ